MLRKRFSALLDSEVVSVLVVLLIVFCSLLAVDKVLFMLGAIAVITGVVGGMCVSLVPPEQHKAGRSKRSPGKTPKNIRLWSPWLSGQRSSHR